MLRLEQLPVDYRTWNNDTSLETLYGGDTLTPSIYEHTNELGQSFKVLTVDGGPGPTILSSLPLDHRIDPLYILRMQTKALHAGAHVIASEIPGVTKPKHFFEKGAFQTPQQTFAAFRGDFRLLVTEQLKAMIIAGNLKDGDVVQLFGESLGSHMVSAMAQVIASGELGIRLQISKIELLEPIIGAYTLRQMAQVSKRLLVDEERLRQTYLKENRDIGIYDVVAAGADTALRIMQLPSSYVAAMGVRRSIASRLLDAAKDPQSESRVAEAEVVIYRAVHSTVSFAKDALHLVAQLRAAGLSSKGAEMVPGKNERARIGHAFPVSLVREAAFAEYQAA